MAPDGSDDTHSPNWGNNRTWTGILAPGLSKRCIWNALQNRRVYSSHDRNRQLWFRVNNATMGTIMDEPVQAVEIEVAVEDGDADDQIAKLELLEDGVVNTTGPSVCVVRRRCDSVFTAAARQTALVRPPGPVRGA